MVLGRLCGRALYLLSTLPKSWLCYGLYFTLPEAWRCIIGSAFGNVKYILCIWRHPEFQKYGNSCAQSCVRNQMSVCLKDCRGNVCFTCAGYLQLLKTKSTMYLNDTVGDGLLDSDTAQEAHWSLFTNILKIWADVSDKHPCWEVHHSFGEVFIEVLFLWNHFPILSIPLDKTTVLYQWYLLPHHNQSFPHFYLQPYLHHSFVPWWVKSSLSYHWQGLSQGGRFCFCQAPVRTSWFKSIPPLSNPNWNLPSVYLWS